ncbi:hypothetical protein CRM22_010283 [Opisthorchis felineus]|uniref:Uncharacterized protein n=1 Tax=Opisthorchis felineus TaxID=147828 RepID=A0A4S2KZQ6_OPIFE|nr:hypothetical protein CRM22_010283 [Opisthorchis felineus]
MIIFIALFTFGLLTGFVTRRIPDYDQCIENCGKDPLDDLEESRKFDACRDECIGVELNVCVGEAIDAANRRKCMKKARKRCVEDCRSIYS